MKRMEICHVMVLLAHPFGSSERILLIRNAREWHFVPFVQTNTRESERLKQGPLCKCRPAVSDHESLLCNWTATQDILRTI